MTNQSIITAPKGDGRPTKNLLKLIVKSIHDRSAQNLKLICSKVNSTHSTCYFSTKKGCFFLKVLAEIDLITYNMFCII